MPRAPDGKVAKAESRTALFAHVAARLHEIQYAKDTDFFRALGLNVSAKAGRDAMQPFKKRLTKWLLVDEPELDLDVSVLRFEPTGDPRETFDTLAGISGVRQLIQVASTGEVIAVVVFDGARARRRLRAVIEEQIGVRPRWDEVERETFAPARRTWRDLAAKAARDEDLIARWAGQPDGV